MKSPTNRWSQLILTVLVVAIGSLHARADDEWYGNQDGNGGGDTIVMEPITVSSGDSMESWLVSINTAELGRQLSEASNAIMDEANKTANEDAMNQIQETLGTVDLAQLSVACLEIPANCQFTRAQLYAALEMIKNTLPHYYSNVIAKSTIKLSVSKDTYAGESAPERLANGSVIGFYIGINPNMTEALGQFSGTKKDFIAALLVHESLHIYYYGEKSIPELRTPENEASVRFYTEEWAIANGVPEVTPGSRGADGMPNYQNILADVKSNPTYAKP